MMMKSRTMFIDFLSRSLAQQSNYILYKIRNPAGGWVGNRSRGMGPKIMKQSRKVKTTIFLERDDAGRKDTDDEDDTYLLIINKCILSLYCSDLTALCLHKSVILSFNSHPQPNCLPILYCRKALFIAAFWKAKIDILLFPIFFLRITLFKFEILLLYAGYRKGYNRTEQTENIIVIATYRFRARLKDICE